MLDQYREFRRTRFLKTELEVLREKTKAEQEKTKQILLEAQEKTKQVLLEAQEKTKVEQEKTMQAAMTLLTALVTKLGN